MLHRSKTDKLIDLALFIAQLVQDIAALFICPWLLEQRTSASCQSIGTLIATAQMKKQMVPALARAKLVP